MIARGSAELAILSLLADQPLYGFEISKQIEERTDGALHFTLASLYPMLYDLEKRGWISGQWQSNEAGRDRRENVRTVARVASADGQGRAETVTLTTRRIMPRSFHWRAALGLLLMGAPLRAADAPKPNIVVIFGDDIGMWNVGAYTHGMMGRVPDYISRAMTGYAAGAPFQS